MSDRCICCMNDVSDDVEGLYCSVECKTDNETYSMSAAEKRRLKGREQEVRNAVDAAIDRGDDDVAYVVPEDA